MIPTAVRSRDGANKAISGMWAADSLRGRYARGAVWSLVGTVVSQALGFLASLVTARLLGRVQFGEIGMIQSTVGMLGVFAGLGLGLTATKHVAQFRKVAPRRAENIMALSMSIAVFAGVVMTATLACGAFRAAQSINAPHLKLALRIASPLLALGALAGVQNGLLAGLESFKTIAHINLARGIVSFPLAIIGVKFWGLEGAVTALVGSAAIGVLIAEIAVRRECLRNGLRFRWHGGWGECRILGSFALPSLLSNAAVGPVTWLANMILVSHREGYGELGLLNAANQCRTVALFLPATFLQVALPLLSSSTDEPGTDSTFARVLEGTQNATVAIVLPVVTLMMFLSDVIVRLYGVSFASGGPIVMAVAFAVSINAAGAATGPAIQAKGRMWLALGINLSWGVTTVLFVWLTARRGGALSIAYGTALGYLLTTLWAFLYLRKELPKGMLKRVFEAMIVSIALLIVASALTPTERMIFAVPAVFLVSWITLTRLSARHVRDALWKQMTCGAPNGFTWDVLKATTRILIGKCKPANWST